MEISYSFNDILRLSITPVALISGVGLILLTLANRLGRTIDRSRIIISELNNGLIKKKEVKITELKILYKRSKILRSSIASISFSVLTSSLIIPVLIIINISHINFNIIGGILLILSITGIIVSSILLLIDVVLTLKALKYEVKEYITK
jgi:hypothetical protein